MSRPLLFLAAVFLIGCGDTDDTDAQETDVTETDTVTGPLSILEVLPCDDERLGLQPAVLTSFAAANFTRCALPFGVLIAAEEGFPDAYVQMAIRVAAEIADPDKDGLPNDPAVLEAMSQGVYLPMPITEEGWASYHEPKLQTALGRYGIMTPLWWLGPIEDSGPSTYQKAVFVEEIVHAFTQFGYSPVYPEIFSVNTWNSVVGQETQSAQCDWWQHPENDCPDSPSQFPGGDCSDPNCDVTEFYHQVLITYVGMEPAWYGIGFPESKEELLERLSEPMLDALSNPKYHQIQAPLTFDYPLDGEE